MQTRRTLGTALGAAAIGAAAHGSCADPAGAGNDDSTASAAPACCASPPCLARCRSSTRTSPPANGPASRSTWRRASPRAFNAKLEYVESTYANSVLDLQANKVDLAFALNPTPQRALAIGFTRAYYMHPFGYVARRGFAARTWEDLNKPDVRVVSLIGSLIRRAARALCAEGAGHRREGKVTMRSC